MQSQAASETHVALFRPFWKRKPFLIFVFRIWLRRMFMWSQWCAWSSGFRRKVATAKSFLVAIPRVPVAKCDYAPGFFEPWTMLIRSSNLGLEFDIVTYRKRSPSRSMVRRPGWPSNEANESVSLCLSLNMIPSSESGYRVSVCSEVVKWPPPTSR